MCEHLIDTILIWREAELTPFYPKRKRRLKSTESPKFAKRDLLATKNIYFLSHLLKFEVAITFQNKSINLNLPSHEVPLPVYPLLHMHEYDDLVFVQLALASQSLSVAFWHSFMSK